MVYGFTQGLGFRVQGSGYRFQGLRFKVFWAERLGFKRLLDKVSGLRVQDPKP